MIGGLSVEIVDDTTEQLMEMRWTGKSMLPWRAAGRNCATGSITGGSSRSVTSFLRPVAPALRTCQDTARGFRRSRLARTGRLRSCAPVPDCMSQARHRTQGETSRAADAAAATDGRRRTRCHVGARAWTAAFFAPRNPPRGDPLRQEVQLLDCFRTVLFARARRLRQDCSAKDWTADIAHSTLTISRARAWKRRDDTPEQARGPAAARSRTLSRWARSPLPRGHRRSPPAKP